MTIHKQQGGRPKLKQDEKRPKLTDKEKYGMIPEFRGKEASRVKLLKEMDKLCAFAIELSQVPKRSDWERRQKKLEAAGQAIRDLEPPFKKIYQGIGDHLVDEATKLQAQLDLLGKKKAGRPREYRKLYFLKTCWAFLQEMLENPDGEMNDSFVDLVGNYEDLERGTPPDFVVNFAREIWVSEGIDEAEIEDWKAHVADNWSRTRFLQKGTQRRPWKENLIEEPIDFLE